MADTLALAYTTAVLKSLLVAGVSRAGISSYLHDAPAVTTLPPDRVLVGESELAQLNLFLYQVTPGSSIRPGSAMLQSSLRQKEPLTAPNRPTSSSLQLDLHYLLTAYGNRGFEIELLLGTAVRLLHDQPTLHGPQLQEALQRLESSEDQRLFAAFLRQDGSERLQQLTITPQFLTIEELSRLWSALQARYRPSVGYKVTMLVSVEPLQELATLPAHS